jgi:hypothetical protein
MTLPYERYHAVTRTEQFLKELCDPKKTPRVPKDIRQQAYHCLHHYPSKQNMDVAATLSPIVFETNDPIDKLTLLILDYEEGRK